MIKIDAVIRVPATECGSEARRDLTIDPFPTAGGGVEIHAGQYGRVVEIADLREALDRAERLIEEDKEQ